MMFRSAIVRLTVWYVALASGLCLLFSAVVYHLSTGELGEALNHQYNSFIDKDHDRDNILPPDTDIQRRGKHLFGELVWFNAVVIVGSSVVGYFLARRTLRPIETAHQTQIRFTADASHELRTPLAAMRADTEVALMETDLSAQARRTLEGNVHDIERLEKLTSQLLDIARYQHKSSTGLALLDLDEIVQSVAKQLSHAAQEKHIRISQDVHPAQLMGDEHGLRQLVTILLDNAVKYSHRGDVVQISLSHDKTTAQLVIQDAGIGIPADDLPHVFERFYRSANAKSSNKTAKTAGGYGLGLPLAQEIVSAHNGAIHMQSSENSGTSVRVTFPLAHPSKVTGLQR